MNNGGGSPVAVATCTQADGVNVDLGSIGSSGLSTTPVSSANGGSGTLAYALISTNSQNGVTLGYRAVQDGATGGRLKIATQTCSGTSTLDASSGVTDQCFNSAAGARTNWAAAPEKFGMTIPGINCGSVPAGTYTCLFTGGNTNMQPQTNYNGDVYTYGTTATYGVGNGFAWDQSGATTTIASSATSTIKVVAFEAVMLKFAALAAVTTPTGQYTTSADFIATPTF